MSNPATAPTTDLVSRTSELDRFARLGKWLALLESGDDGELARGAAAALRFYYAEQLDLPPTAVAEITVIHGRLFMGAQLMRALAQRAGYRVARSVSTADICTAQLLRIESGELIGESTYTIEEARLAGLIRDRSAWKTHPARMLWARASTLVIRDFAPAVSLGMWGDDEREEILGEIVEEHDDVDWPDEPTASIREQLDLQDEPAD
jgi:hypothetical protein